MKSTSHKVCSMMAAVVMQVVEEVIDLTYSLNHYRLMKWRQEQRLL